MNMDIFVIELILDLELSQLDKYLEVNNSNDSKTNTYMKLDAGES